MSFSSPHIHPFFPPLPPPMTPSMETLFAAGTSASDSAPIADYFSLSSRCCAAAAATLTLRLDFLKKYIIKVFVIAGPSVQRRAGHSAHCAAAAAAEAAADRGMRATPERVRHLSWCCVDSDARDIHYRLCCTAATS